MTPRTFSRWLILGFIGTLAFPSLEGAMGLGREPRAIASPSSHSSPHAATFVWPARGAITQAFSQGHPGIDIAGAMGTPILAAKAGKVVYAEWDSFGLGNAIKIEHEDGTYTVYGHNQRLWVRRGQTVKQGQAIATMGSTGNSTGPHLHFEMRSSDRPRRWVDPLNELPSSLARQTPPQPISAAVLESRVTSDENSCKGRPLIQGETTRFRVRVCEQNGELFYLGEFKNNRRTRLRLQARHLGGDRYQAENGSYSYQVSAAGVEVWRNGRQLRSERFLN